MHLYHFPLLNATGITKATVGNFSGTKQQEICVCRGESLLELLVVDTETGRVQTLLSHDVFGVVRSIMPFRMTGGQKGAYGCL
jgi:splicing factor 3B subunit 3